MLTVRKWCAMDYKGFISAKITELRISKNISSRKLSLDLGLSNSYITQIENKVKMPSIENLALICDYFGITLADFFSNSLTLASLSSDQSQLLDNAKNLTSEQLFRLNEFIKTIK